MHVGAVLAQHPYFYSLNEENGWPSNETYSLLQDKRGYVWIGCNAGLFRYNGSTYNAYTHPSANSKAVSGLRMDYKGRVWCYNFTGQIFYAENDSLILFKDYSSICKTFPRFMFDRQHRIWVSSEQLLEVFDSTGKQLYIFSQYKNEKNESIIWGETGAHDSYVYIHTYGNGIWRWNEKKPEQLIRISKTEQELSVNQKSSFRLIRNQLYMIVEYNPIRKYELWKIQPHGVTKLANLPLPQDNDIIYSIKEAKDNGYWLLTSSGVRKLDDAFRMKKSMSLFADEKISDMLIDREGSYWFSSLQNGAMVVPSIDLITYHAKNSTLLDDNISTLAIYRNNLLLGTYKGDLYLMQVSTGKSRPFSSNFSPVYRHVRKIRLYQNKVFASRGAFTRINGEKELPLNSEIRNIRDFDFMGDSCFLVFNNQISVCAVTDFEKQHSLRTIRPVAGSAVVCDSDSKRVYFACNDGFFVYRTGNLQPLLHEGKPIFASSLQLHRGNLWIGTINSGILGLSAGDTVVKQFLYSGNTLCSNSIRQLFSTGKNMWVVTDKCLLQVNNMQTASYSLPEGLLPRQINAVVELNNHVWLATNKGLISMPLNMPWKNLIPPTVLFTQLVINDQECSWENVPELKWNQNSFQFFFDGISLRSRGDFHYRYRLLPADSSWTVTANGNARYNALAPGNYRFEVLCVNEDGIQSGVESLTFIISPPYWQTWWFYLLMAAGVSTLVYTLFYLRFTYLKRKAEGQHELIRSQLTALKAQMNPHFMYNTLNSIQDLMVQQDIKNTNYYLSQFGTLMRKVLNASGSEMILLTEEADILTLYLNLEKLRFGEQFTFSLHISDDVDTEMTRIPSMVIQPFVENALKHGLLHKHGDKLLRIRFERNGNNLVCTITDNGVGRKKAGEIKARARISHQSFATEATRKRLELLNNARKHKILLHITDLEENGQPSGTRVVLEIPAENI